MAGLLAVRWLRRRYRKCVGTVQDEIVREAQTMRQQSHPNVLPLHCSFVHRQHLWMVMPYVAGGSVLNIMKFAYAEVSSKCDTPVHLSYLQ